MRKDPIPLRRAGGSGRKSPTQPRRAGGRARSFSPPRSWPCARRRRSRAFPEPEAGKLPARRSRLSRGGRPPSAPRGGGPDRGSRGRSTLRPREVNSSPRRPGSGRRGGEGRGGAGSRRYVHRGPGDPGEPGPAAGPGRGAGRGKESPPPSPGGPGTGRGRGVSPLWRAGERGRKSPIPPWRAGGRGRSFSLPRSWPCARRRRSRAFPGPGGGKLPARRRHLSRGGRPPSAPRGGGPDRESRVRSTLDRVLSEQFAPGAREAGGGAALEPAPCPLRPGRSG